MQVETPLINLKASNTTQKRQEIPETMMKRAANERADTMKRG